MLSFIVSDSDQKKIGEESLTIIAEVFITYFSLPELQVELSLATPEEIQEINQEYRQLNEPTDVLSFQLLSNLEEIQHLPAGISVLLGSIVICPEKVETYQETLPQMVEHGLLHLLGFDHITDLEKWQQVERPIIHLLKQKGLIIPEVPIS